MAYEVPILTAGMWKAAANYSSATDQYTCVQITSGTLVAQQTADGGPVLGILQNKPASGSVAEVMCYGITKARVDPADTIAVGNKVQCTTDAGISASTALAMYVLGRALEATTTTGVISILITHQGAGSTEGATGA